MELRHLRYFVAVAEARSLKLAAEEKLHTTQPSLSRQIRDLEDEVGASLFVRGARGVELTAAGRVFLDHARVMLSQAETAIQSARQMANPTIASGIRTSHAALSILIRGNSVALCSAVNSCLCGLPRKLLIITAGHQNHPPR